MDAIQSQSVEDYLKAIYELEEIAGKAATKELAGQLGCSQPAVSEMIKQLAQKGLVSYKPYHGVVLTSSGRQIALRQIRRHRLVETLLVDLLGMPWDQVHDEAERWEHVISEALEARIDAVLGHPATDPHGAPIPALDGSLPTTPRIPLSDMTPSQTGKVAAVSGRNPELLRYLERLGIVPGALVRFLDSAPFGGPLIVQVGDTECSLGQEAASQVQIEMGG
jgi:DtxR family Mn-dependent transcriptional regulator